MQREGGRGSGTEFYREIGRKGGEKGALRSVVQNSTGKLVGKGGSRGNRATVHKGSFGKGQR